MAPQNPANPSAPEPTTAPPAPQLPPAAATIPPVPQFFGGPGAGADGVVPPLTNPQAPPAAAAPAPAVAPPASSPIIIGGRAFTTQAEADAYLRLLESKSFAQPAPQQQQFVPQNPAAPADVDPGELMFTDPKTATRLIKEQAKQEIRNESAQVAARENVWREFYRQHPDLADAKDVVEAQLAIHMPAISTLPQAQGLPFIATQARARLSQLRQAANPGAQLPPGPAIVAGASGAAPATQPTAPALASSFISEIKANRAGVKRAKA